MLIRTTRWSLITAPAVAGVALLIFGTAGSISAAFGVFLIGLAPIIWMWNWFLRMSFADDEREQETARREQRARDRGVERAGAPRPPARPARARTPRRAPHQPQRRRRRPL